MVSNEEVERAAANLKYSTSIMFASNETNNEPMKRRKKSILKIFLSRHLFGNNSKADIGKKIIQTVIKSNHNPETKSVK